MNEVTRTGKVFATGEYADKNFSLTDEEADAAVAAFSPVHANVEHRESEADGLLGGLRRVWRQGKELFAEAFIPQNLHDKLQAAGRPLKPSLEWDRTTKRITGVAWVKFPRIEDAALMSAAFGTEVKTDPNTVWFDDSATEFETLAPLSETPSLPNDPALTSATGAKPMSTQAKEPKSFREKLAAVFAALTGKTTDEADAALTTAQFSDEDFAPKTDPKIAADMAQFAADKRDHEAKATMAQFKADAKLMPYEEKRAAALFALLLEHEAQNPRIVTFSDQTGSEVAESGPEMLRALIAGRSKHGLFSELLPEHELKALENHMTTAQFGAAKDPDKARMDNGLESTPLGRKVLAHRRASA